MRRGRCLTPDRSRPEESHTLGQGSETGADPFGYRRKRARRDRGIRWTLWGLVGGVAMSAFTWLLPLPWRLPFGIVGAFAVLAAFVGSCLWVFSTIPKERVTRTVSGPVTIETHQQTESRLDHLMAQVAVAVLAFMGWMFWTVFLLLQATGAK